MYAAAATPCRHGLAHAAADNEAPARCRSRWQIQEEFYVT